MTQMEYLQNRVESQIKWMEAKCKHHQDMYKRLKLCEIISGAAIPLLVGFNYSNTAIPLITGFLGVTIVILNGIQQLYKFHENWLVYRTAIEELKREKFLFESQTDPYNTANSFQKFVQNFEALLADENKKWKSNWFPKVEMKN